MTLTQDRRTALFGGCPLFQGLDESGLAALAGAAVEVEFPADRVIARQGEIGTGFFVVVDMFPPFLTANCRPEPCSRRPDRDTV